MRDAPKSPVHVFSSSGFVAGLGDACSPLALFDAIPEASVYAKDQGGRFTLVNAALLRLLGLAGPAEFLGKRDADFFAPSIAAAYVAEDQVVLRGKPIVNKRWQVPGPDGRMRWYLSTKVPLLDKAGRVVGLCGLLRDQERANEEAAPFRGMAEVIAHMDANATRPVRIGELAAMAGLSPSQFNRRFKALSGLAPGDYLLKVRVCAAERELAAGNRSVTEIARLLGFHDHSHFSRKFHRETGQTPTAFRRAARTASFPRPGGAGQGQ